MVGTSFLHYAIVAELGRGGMGVVYRADDTRLGRPVAIKFLADHLSRSQEARDRFMLEARAAAALTHPNIATLYDVVESEDRLFITMEFVDGKSLKDVVEEDGLSLENAVDYAIQIARGLERAHEARIIHRDIKPANMMITGRGEVKILDFGLAKFAGGAGLSKTGATVGTAAYMSPEQIRADEVDARTDLWSLGVVLYELVTSRRPFVGEYEHALYYAILNLDPEPPSVFNPSVPPELEQIIQKLIRRELRERYCSASEVRADLEALAAPRQSASTSMQTRSPAAATRRDSTSSFSSTISDTERRQLTVVYCEMDATSGFTDDFDPEDVFEATNRFRALCEKQFRHFGGQVGTSSGDGVIGYFGYPTAREDDARQAIRCALAIREAFSETSARDSTGGSSDTVRISVNTGLSVVGEEQGELQVHGAVANLAARITTQLEPDSVVVGKPTYDICRGYFDFEDLGTLKVRGVPEGIRIFEVLGVRDAQSRIGFGAETDLTPMVGRDLEMSLLRQRWKVASSGDGCVVLVSGEPGLGKSRLVDAFQREVELQGGWVMSVFASDHNSASALHPFAEYLGQSIPGFESADDVSDQPESKRAKLVQSFLREHDLPSDPFLGLFCDLLSILPPLGETFQALAPFAQKQKLMQGLLHILTAKEAEGPGLIILEDLHWADPSSLELVEMMVSQLPGQRIMALLTTRPPSHPDWLGRAYATEITLGRLSREEVLSISRHRGHGKKLPDEILKEVVQRTDGIPLFVEELTKMLLESGILVERDDRFELDGPIPAGLIPPTLQASLTARLDGLASEKHVAQVGSVVGRKFAFELIKAVSEEDERSLEAAFTRLVDAELMFQKGFVPRATFTFKHALIQDTAYNSLLKSKRRELHERVGHELSSRSSEARPEEVARHYSLAELPEKAIPLWETAGQKAMARNANLEAVEHFRAALDLVDSLNAGSDRDLTELRILNQLGPAFMMTRGYWDPGGEKLFHRAQELCGRIDEVQPLVFALQGLAAIYLTRADYESARRTGEQSLSITKAAGEPGFLLMSHTLLSCIHLFTGVVEKAQHHADEVTRLYEPEKHDHLGLLGWGHFDVGALSYRQLATQLLGYPDQARKQSNDLIEAVRGMDYHMSYYHGYLYGGLVALARRDWAGAVTIIDEYLPKGLEYGDPFPVTICSIVHHLGLSGRENRETFRSAKTLMDRLHASGFGLGLSMLLGVYAQRLLEIGDLGGAENALNEATAHIEKSGGEFWEAEILRLKGQLELAGDGSVAGAEALFRRAIDLAHDQNCRVFELRASTSLARLLADQGNREEARGTLEPVYSWFTEGHDTPDLRDAKAALESLA